MPLYQVLVLGFIQGLTEFLPVSSTAHLYLVRWLFGWKTEGLNLDIMLHLGTLLAVVLYFLPLWITLLTDLPTLGLLTLASLPVAAAGLLFEHQARTTWRHPYVIGAMLIAVGILLALADSAGVRSRDLNSLTLTDALAIGAAQALAIVPGASRSGVTIAAALFRNFEREPAAALSFLLSAPPIAAAAAKTLFTLRRENRLSSLLNLPFAAGIAASAVTGYFAIDYFLAYLRHGGLRPFAYYRVIFGIIVVALALIRRPAR